MTDSNAKGTKLDSILKELRGTCDGRCFGTDIGIQIVHSRCPDPCDRRYLDRVKEQAKNKAWSKAQEHCKQGGKYCSCHGTYNALIPEQCVSIKDADGHDVCLYFAAYAYIGECGYWF